MNEKKEKIFAFAVLLISILLLTISVIGCTPLQGEPIDRAKPIQEESTDIEEQRNETVTAVNLYYLGQMHTIEVTTDIAKEMVEAFWKAIPLEVPENDKTPFSVSMIERLKDYKKSETCVELVFTNASPLVFKRANNTEFTVDGYDKLFICLTKDDNLLFFSEGNTYQRDPIGGVNSSELKKLAEPYMAETFEMVKYLEEEGQKKIQIGSEQFILQNYEENLKEFLSEKAQEMIMYRAVTFYEATYYKNFNIMRILSTPEFFGELEKIAANEELPKKNRGGDVAFYLNHYTDVGKPQAISKPAMVEQTEKLPVKYRVTLQLNDFSWATLIFVMDEATNTPLIDEFLLAMA